MSRERPTAPPRAVPDQQRGVKNEAIEDRKKRQREAAERLKGFSGAGFMGYLAATFSKGPLKRAPQMIRRGYEASIVDELRDFFTWRGWRPKRCRPAITHKERRHHLRRMAQAGLIRRVGRGRFELVKDSPHVWRGEVGTHA